MELDGTQTLKNLARAFEAETHDGARYQFLRTKAENNKQMYIANLLKILATNEMAHAKLWFDFITEKGAKSVPNIELKAGMPYETSTDFNEEFRITAEVETKEGSKIYKDFAATARKEGFDNIAAKFDMVAAIELQHASIISQIYEGLKSATLYKSDKDEKWKCVVCGHIATSKTAWKACPVCGMPQGNAEGQIKLK